jgi:pyridoxamine 5'-phosphate oxidase
MASIVSNQGMVLESMEDLNNKYLQLFENNKINVFSRPINWGGYKVRPHRIELFEFKESRFHLRSMFYIENMKWLKAYLQP